jgi:hypothetical protein
VAPTVASVIDVPVIKTQPINFIVGCRIEAQDINGAWQSATIIYVDSDEREALIQFDKDKGVDNEWFGIHFDSDRLRSTDYSTPATPLHFLCLHLYDFKQVL